MEHISKLSLMMVILYKCIENNINWLTEQEVICYIKLSLGSDEKPIIKLSSTMSSKSVKYITNNENRVLEQESIYYIFVYVCVCYAK